MPHTSELFPLGGENKIISVFWADVDTRGGAGKVWYEESTNTNNLNKAASDIKAAFPSVVPSNFEVTHLFIVTWEDVGYYNQKKDKVRTYVHIS